MFAIEGTVHLVLGSRQSNLESYFNYLNCAKVPCESFRTTFGLKHTEIATNLFRIPKLRERDQVTLEKHTIYKIIPCSMN